MKPDLQPLRKTTKFILMDYKREKDKLEELKTEPIMNRISKYKNTRIQHVGRIRSDGKATGTKELLKRLLED
jgi:hypothetical protein